MNFSLEPDVDKLVKAGLVSPSWNQNATHGFVTDSVAVIIVRKGNPKHITGWSDLIKPGVGVLTPNPFTSGSARWNIMAAYGAQLKEGKTPAQAEEYLKALFHNVVSQDSSARNALQTFLAGRGDALIDYEDEAIADEKKGAPIEYVIPKRHDPDPEPDRGVGSGGNATEGQKFVNYLLSPAGQTDLGAEGLPPGDLRACRAPASSPRRRACSRSNPRRLESRDEAVLRTGNGDRHEDRAVAGSLHRQIALHPSARWRYRARRAAVGSPRSDGGPSGASQAGQLSGGAAAGAWPRALLGKGLLGIYLSVLVLLPVAALLAQAGSGGTSAFWREVIKPGGARRDQADAGQSRRSSWSSTRSSAR